VLPVGGNGFPIPHAQEYYHTKEGIFTDAAGNQVGFTGSVNESAQAWMRNFEEFQVSCSWEGERDREVLANLRISFNDLWEGRDADWLAVDLPEAVRRELIRRAPAKQPATDPLERHAPAIGKDGEGRPPFAVVTDEERLLFQFLRDAPHLLNAGDLGAATSAVAPWPHQLQVARTVVERFPDRALLCDEVGLGKTIEAGLIIHRQLLCGRARRALILVPENLQHQWLVEMRRRFNLEVALFDAERFLASDADNPFEDAQLALVSLEWLKDDERQKIFSDSNSSKYPVYFVMANGGASRAGYWTSSLLSKMEDSSKGNFSKHLFCLSGASGGSVGNATFFSLLRAKNQLQKNNLTLTDASTQYLKSDFLTFTISHLLGPDIFRNFLPFLNSLEIDRGRALALSLEKAPAKNSFLYDSFAVKFSSLITQKGQSYSLPVLCINATRMSDGAPSVFSNILIENNGMRDNYFNNRIDILSKLGESRDIKLSTAVVLGASFPYISPAGRIDNTYLSKNKKGGWKEKKESQYFVDGGYFDNSGAGVVNEMITALQNMMEKDSLFSPYKNKLEFYVIHIMNTDPKKEKRDAINSLTNDLLAPAKTIMGSYGKQTSINDQRLKYYLYTLYNDEKHYTKIDLYDDAVSDFSYSMNWVFSERQRDTMNAALKRNTAFNNEMSRILSMK